MALKSFFKLSLQPFTSISRKFLSRLQRTFHRIQPTHLPQNKWYAKFIPLACPIEKVVLWVDHIYLTWISEIDEGVAEGKVSPAPNVEPKTPGPSPSMLITKPFSTPKRLPLSVSMFTILCCFPVEYENLLQRYGMFIAKHFADPRIVNIDTKDVVVQSLACFICYDSSLKVLENLDPGM